MSENAKAQIEKLRQDILASNLQGLVNSGNKAKELLDRACVLFEEYETADQVIACAAILGMQWATWEGMTTDFEKDLGVLIGFPERLLWFNAMCEVIYKEALSAAQHPDCPDPNKGKVM